MQQTSGAPLQYRETSEIHAQPRVAGAETEWAGLRGGVRHGAVAWTARGPALGVCGKRPEIYTKRPEWLNGEGEGGIGNL